MIGKYINQFMADNELLVNEEFFIKNMDGNRVLIGLADRYKIEDIDGGILTAVVMNEKDKPPAMLLESALIDLLVEAENRALAEVKAKELYKDYKNSNDFFTPSDVSHVKGTFKIVPAVLVDIREALCKECAQKEGK